MPNLLKKTHNPGSPDLTMFYSLPKLVCSEIYLHDFQFKVPNYITCTNIPLKKMGIVESDLCTFCNLTKEDISHILERLRVNCWKKCTNSNINLTSQDVILGISGNNNGREICYLLL